MLPSCSDSHTHVQTLSKFEGEKEMGDEGEEVCIMWSPSMSPTSRDAQQAGILSQVMGGPGRVAKPAAYWILVS